ncbi:MAG: hypothetical protein SCALA702_23470 [Melioribacteraceae bacterium]|nr:MAG: hypothetical protein SCALA702_23470 [Melioribacteraceae bacterium]
MKIKLLLLFLSFIIFSCGSVEPDYKPVAIDEGVLADQFGNKNNETLSAEINSLRTYFKSNKYAFVLRGGVSKSLSRQKASAIVDHFYIQSPVYRSKDDFRVAYNGVNLGHESVGIMQIEYMEGRYVFTKYYRAPGNNVYASAWFTIDLH